MAAALWPAEICVREENPAHHKTLALKYAYRVPSLQVLGRKVGEGYLDDLWDARRLGTEVQAHRLMGEHTRSIIVVYPRTLCLLYKNFGVIQVDTCSCSMVCEPTTPRNRDKRRHIAL